MNSSQPVKLLWLSLFLDWHFNPEVDGKLGRTEIENERCCEMPRVLAEAFGTEAGRLCLSTATWAHVCAVHMFPLPSETGEGALASHEEAFWSLSNVSFPPGDLLSTKWHKVSPRSCITQQQHEAPRCAVPPAHRMFFVQGTWFQFLVWFCFSACGYKGQEPTHWFGLNLRHHPQTQRSSHFSF